MKPVNVQFLFDFGSPNAYLSHKVIPQIESRAQVSFDYVPILLGGLFKLANNRSPAEAYAGIPLKRTYEALELQRFVDRHGLADYRRNPYFPVNTLQLMRGAIAARRQGCFERYVDLVYAAMWEQERKMDDPQVFAEALVRGGLDADALIQATQDASVKQELLDNTRRAYERGAFGSPTFFVGDEIYFGKDRLRDVEEEIARARQA